MRCIQATTGIMWPGANPADDTTLPFCSNDAFCVATSGVGYICSKMIYNPF